MHDALRTASVTLAAIIMTNKPLVLVSGWAWLKQPMNA